MTTSYGSGVSGVLPPDERGFEVVVYQQNKPILDKELNLSEDLATLARRTALTTATPSGWVAQDGLTTSQNAAIWAVDPTPDEVFLTSPMLALVNGWLVTVADTNVAGIQQPIPLTPAPFGAGVKRTDMIVLEVWRRLLSPSPSTDGKSVSGKIFRYGNVKYGDDGQNLDDDLLDPALGAESTKRIQVQYRLRAISGVDLFTFPAGLDDHTNVLASSVPLNLTPDGTPTLFPYLNQGSAGDPGLWRAGDGDPTNTLGTADGYMYAIPLCAFFRRNQDAWDRNTNANGAGQSIFPAVRPDGLFYDIIAELDFVDLRRSVLLAGWNQEELLAKNVRYLLDNVLVTEWTSLTAGAGVDGHTVTWCDQIGVPGGGDSVDTGNAVPAGPLVRTFDGVCRTFSDRVVYETVTVKLTLADLVVPAGAWSNGAVVALSPTLLSDSAAAFAGENFPSFAPTDTVFLDATNLRFQGDGTVPLSVSGPVPYTTLTGLGTLGTLFLTLGNLASVPGLTGEDIYVDLLVAYPQGQGLSRTPTNDYGPSSVAINNLGPLGVAAPVYWSSTYASSVDKAHRELTLTYTTGDIGPVSLRCNVNDAGATFIRLPERTASISAIGRNNAPLVGGTSIDATGRVLTFDNAGDYLTYPDTVEVTYRAIRPFPQAGEQISVFYETRAPQTIRTGNLSNSLRVLVRYVSPHVYVIGAGSATPDGEAFPFPSAYVQTGGLYNTSIGAPADDAWLSGILEMSVADFGAQTGMLRLPTFVPYEPTDKVTFLRVNGDVDAENRTFYKEVASGYRPNAFAQSLSTPRPHKVVLPLLAELTQDTSFGKQGQLVMILLCRWAPFDDGSSVAMTADLTLNTTSASVFRLKANPITRGT